MVDTQVMGLLYHLCYGMPALVDTQVMGLLYHLCYGMPAYNHASIVSAEFSPHFKLAEFSWKDAAAAASGTCQINNLRLLVTLIWCTFSNAARVVNEVMISSKPGCDASCLLGGTPCQSAPQLFSTRFQHVALHTPHFLK